MNTPTPCRLLPYVLVSTIAEVVPCMTHGCPHHLAEVVTPRCAAGVYLGPGSVPLYPLPDTRAWHQQSESEPIIDTHTLASVC